MMIEWGIFLLSAATLAFEVNLTRIFSVAQFYHFAFMVVSLALLGFGASGTFLTLFPRWRGRDLRRSLLWLSGGFSLAVIGAYALTLYVPFDSFRIAHDERQVGILALHYLALATPFFCSGVAVGLVLARRPARVARTYAANLSGSAVGCLLALALPAWVGGAGAVLCAAALGLVAALFFRRLRRDVPALLGTGAQLILVVLLLAGARWTPDFLAIRLSPYKSLSYALLYPDAEPIFRRWNGFSRVDVVRSQNVRSLPGRGFRCSDLPPAQVGLTVDGDDLNPISHVPPGFSALPFTDCLLAALPYRLRLEAEALVLEPRGGFDVLVALSEGARDVTAVEPNPLIVEAVRAQGAWAGALYDDPRVHLVLGKGRAYVRRATERYDVVHLSLTAPQRPVTSGAYSLAEDYGYTVEAFEDYLTRLEDDGLLVVTRWLQVPPSEALRAFALAVEAVERSGGDPRTDIVALRSYQQMLILVRRGPFTAQELDAVRAFATPRAFDLVSLPDLQAEEVNRYSVMPEPVYYRAFTALLEAPDREAWYRAYPFDVRPPRDDRPFFTHFFKWAQAPQVLALAGQTWQPFGGAGYFVLLILLALALVAAAGLIVGPLLARGTALRGEGTGWGAVAGYFALLGLGYLFVEIPLMQRFILFLGHPAYALAMVLFTVLLFSGVGSLISERVPLSAVLVGLPLSVGLYAWGLPVVLRWALPAPLGLRAVVGVALLAPIGVLMGIPFPKGVALIETRGPGVVAWAWGVNGATSVIASILAALLALSFGFSSVLAVGAACYGGAWLMAGRLRPRSPQSPSR
jgi:hypothetical protein